MKTFISLLGAFLLTGCISHQSGSGNIVQPPLLNEFNRQVTVVQEQAERGDLLSQQRSGRWLLSAGKESRAEPLLRAAAERHQADAQFQLGRLLLEKNPAEGRRWLKAAAEQGHTGAQLNLARYYRSGPLVIDHQQSFNWLLMAAQQGDAVAQNDVGAAYTQGTGVEKNLHQALYWYRQAATQGNALAQFNLAGAYQAGQGIPAQPELAFAWYSAAYENSRDAGLRKIAEKMKLRMYAEATRQGKAVRARQLAERYLSTYSERHKEQK